MNLAFPEWFTPDRFDVLLVRGRWIYARLIGTNVSFLEVGNHLPQSVAKWGERLGYPKGEFDPWSIPYCLRDAEIAYRAADYLRERYDREGSDMRYTAPASALEVYRRRFMVDGFGRVDPERSAFYRGSYYGGRTEVFRHGMIRSGLESVDVKSMYPSIMREPLQNYETAVRCGSIPSSRPYVADVTVTVPDQPIPPLPYRREEKLLFPTGTFRGSFVGAELDYAVDRCGVTVDRVHAVVRFDHERPYLRSYVDEFYPKKLAAEREGDRAMKDFYKMLLNSLYGKFGTAGNSERLAWIDADRTEFDFLETENDPPVYANVIWSAVITALARVKLHRTIVSVRDPVYVDTDSLIYAGSGEVVTGDGLGDWELKGRYVAGEFWRPKAYSLTLSDGGRLSHVRGVPFSFQDAILEEAYVEFTAPLRYREAMRRGDRPNRWVSRSKSLDREYDKRVVLRGGRTEPIRLLEGR
jgi:DNA polymerase elongation subunit (family B)